MYRNVKAADSTVLHYIYCTVISKVMYNHLNMQCSYGLCIKNVLNSECENWQPFCHSE